MAIEDIITDYTRAKDLIRANTLFKASNSEYDGIQMVLNYTHVMESVVKDLFNMSANGIKGIGVFLYGSLGRKEMVSESDVDMLILHEEKGEGTYKEIKTRFKQYVKPFQFCKIDLPEWGNLAEAEIFARKSITEGNQVLEARFLSGDRTIANKVEDIQKMYASPERMVRNIVFQKFYFEQYFKQRVREGNVNVKYCHGGSRDLMFISWFDTLMSRKYDNWKQTKSESPAALVGLLNLYNNGLIDALTLSRDIEALNFNLILRNEILQANKGTFDEGLTFMDDITAMKVFSRISDFMGYMKIRNHQELREEFNRQRKHINDVKSLIWNQMITEKSKVFGAKWGCDFKRAYAESTPEKERAKIAKTDDLLIRIAAIWGATNSGQQRLLRKLMEKERDTDSWEIQASFATSPFCTPDYLHHLGTGLAKEIGYGYILRIICRNPNVSMETLKNIANDTSLESRYKQLAETALEHGKDAANHQV
ncbi:MAG: hypothetical protein PHO02_02000 [Candidatus Nanoarchaeia archaeon]|nr:hypothetical protein [Candidatus Nanoarchaeia archaeon]